MRPAPLLHPGELRLCQEDRLFLHMKGPQGHWSMFLKGSFAHQLSHLRLQKPSPVGGQIHTNRPNLSHLSLIQTLFLSHNEEIVFHNTNSHLNLLPTKLCKMGITMY